MTRTLVRRAALIVLGLVASACAALVGIDPNLDVRAHDAGTDAPDTATAAPTDAGIDAPIAVDGSIPPPVRPVEGTYLYEADGSDQIQGAFIYNPSPYGPTATVTIAYVGTDCFEQTFTLRADYTEMMRLCIKGLELVENGPPPDETRYQKFAVGATASTTETCTPGDVYFSTGAAPGQQWTHDCKGQNTDAKTGSSQFRTVGPYVYSGDQMMTVMGRSVLTKHFHDDRVVNGSQSGTNVADWYFSAEDGTLAAFNRKIDIQYNSVVGQIHYLETVNMTLIARPEASDAGTD
jgi:hypothetical protein